MHVTFFAAEKEREIRLGREFLAGISQSHDTCEVVHPARYPAPNVETDVAVIVGVKGYSRKLFDDHLAAGKHVVYLDKGYLSRGKYHRISVDSFQPLSYFQQRRHADDRLRVHDVHLRPMREKGNHIVLAGGSLKYALWHHMNGQHGHDPMTTWAMRTSARLSHYSRRKQVYRPKPSWPDAVPIPTAAFSRPPESLVDLLTDCWAVVTFGSNAAVDALIAGIPVIVTGDGIAQPLAKMAESSIEDLYLPSEEKRWQWLADLAYCQFTHEEIHEGLAWQVLREEILHDE